MLWFKHQMFDCLQCFLIHINVTSYVVVVVAIVVVAVVVVFRNVLKCSTDVQLCHDVIANFVFIWNCAILGKRRK